MKRPLRVAVADSEQFMLDYYRDLLPRLGHEVIEAAHGRQLLELCRTEKPDLVITDVKLVDMDGLEATNEINREREVPVILVSDHHDGETQARAVQDHVMAYLAKPVKEGDLTAAISLAMARFQDWKALRKEAADLRQALEDRKLVERAKGVVTRRVDVPEAEAFRRLRKLASDQNRKLSEVARDVLGAEEIFDKLDRA
ncbi:MAG TPA: response regulator [Gemmataceae bacterium]|jgi:response regulator NasT|nr:response regulator [Gemmataceae bacterium]